MFSSIIDVKVATLPVSLKICVLSLRISNWASVIAVALLALSMSAASSLILEVLKDLVNGGDNFVKVSTFG